ncbi:MAG: hypothetical protein M1834_005307 [Cirrosporium novae-zelandiae]|nr:MAG: hypothetical protein M1834_005307 [Cirrosporium novae-zelandiae]
MLKPPHTLGPTCALYAEPNVYTRPTSDASPLPPKVRAQFFYASDLPIDDPLSPVPPPTTSSSSRASVPPRAFAPWDSAALEEAWLGLKKDQNHTDKNNKQRRRESGIQRNRGIRITNAIRTGDEQNPRVSVSSVVRSKRASIYSSSVGQRELPKDQKVLLSDYAAHSAHDSSLPVDLRELNEAYSQAGLPGQSKRKHRESYHFKDDVGFGMEKSKTSIGKDDDEEIKQQRKGKQIPGKRRKTIANIEIAEPSSFRSQGGGSSLSSENATPAMFRRMELIRPEPRLHYPEQDAESTKYDSPSTPQQDVEKDDGPKAYVPVGASRLHLVELPDLLMKPIYWSPVHDISSVIRGTWFYKNEMLPVEPELANRLELGYEYMKPWTQTWQDELNSCLEIGAEAEEKIVHRLWPKKKSNMPDSRPVTRESLKPSVPDVDDSATDLGTLDESPIYENKAAGFLTSHANAVKLYKNSSVIYADAINAQILRPSLLPSGYRGRRPLGPIRKGKQIGIAVVRGFDPKIWGKLHPSRKNRVQRKLQEEDLTAQSGTAASDNLHKKCEACEMESERPQVTDLVLVIHGIGQKLSERVESFHFTHAINDFRRQVNLELVGPAVAPYRRKGLGGVMVLPVNWRATLDFGDDASQSNFNAGLDEHDPARNEFSLSEVTPETLPTVRNLINDIVLDVPYYLSHHRPKMNEAVIKEANRIYRLWCKNNPGFHDNGRVHLIAHSLGSVMALDILSKQPTYLPKQIDLTSEEINGQIFEFDSKNVFFCGSPTGLFLLLNNATLLPRKGRNKPHSDGEDIGHGVAGEAGMFGCLAVDNLYNVIHFNDPVATRINAAVDRDYAASLKPPTIPFAGTTFFGSLSNAFKGWTGTPTTPDPNTIPINLEPTRPSVSKLPSTIELETHNFTREEIAEKRMHLLNENGQIDYYLSSGGGPLEFQYLNMLSAHSSYWTLQDFVRFLVIEIARSPGSANTLPILRATKKLTLGRRR